jgi:galactokinase
LSEQVSKPSFAELFGRAPDLLASAPGRVNLMGEHTDYNEGYVLPVAIPQRTRVELARRDDGVARVWSGDVGGTTAPSRYVLGEEARGGGFLDYLQGVTLALREDGFSLPGFDVRIASEVPVGAGLSSSAALSIAFLRALRAAFGLAVDDTRIARIAQRAENDLVGAPVGIMDPMASSLASTSSALFLDTRSLAYELIPIPEAIELVVIDSGLPHNHATGGYRARRAECERACELLGIRSLRDLAQADVHHLAPALPAPLLRRVRHVVTENARVFATVTAMRSGDIASLGSIFAASHASMRDDYEVSMPLIDRLVELARAEPDVVGARLTGGGFGGSVVVVVKRGSGRGLAARITSSYNESSKMDARVLVPRA